LLLSGFVGPRNFEIDSPIFNLSLVSRNFSKTSIAVNKLDEFKKNKNFLSSDQINNKKIVLEWSKKIMYKAENGLIIPRMYFPYIPKNISEFKSTIKKDVFISILLPIALRGNELVLQERKLMKAAFLSNNIYQIENLAKKYKIKNFKKINFSNITKLDLGRIKKELLTKINKIPISIILAQSIIESGWGSSRFAQEGNALFGEWTWKANVGIKPKGNMDANFAVKNFKNILESLNSYILNLNSHPAYFQMRKYRSLKYKAGKKITGYDTANFLNRYAEIGFDYVKKIEDMIKSNKLYRFQKAKLEDF
tara:strand:+ start:187 stop:1110 length:924 start_codon:yes stop_codon:yes gene_type:complete